tara:strand:+ start:810 stop:2990 length:2181 start_codon:yes stop_codon:yes gene_type:complete
MRLGLIAFFSFISTFSYAECDFRTADYIEGMVSPEKIKSIDIEIPKSSKYARNLFKIFSSRSRNIPDNLKKSFKANVIVTFDFGICRYPGEVRQSGDWKDHIKLVNGNPIQSLDVKLKAGNVVGATRFKLLIPETRGGRNEVLGALLLRELDFIAPETFEVYVIVNGVKSLMLFQEKAEKELLERNLRREGPIFEGDESLHWSYRDYAIAELEPLALSRLVNDNWFKKGLASQKIAINSSSRLQKVYLDYARSHHLDENKYFIQLNKKDDYLLNDYHRLLGAMNGAHGLRPHNRQFYFNAIEDRFEPIYYDGNLKFSAFFLESNEGYEFLLHEPISPDLKNRVQKLLSSTDVKERFVKRLKTSASNETFYNKSVNQVISNLELMNNLQLSDSKSNWTSFTQITDYSWYLDLQADKALSQNIVERIKIYGNYATLNITDAPLMDVSISDLARILSKNEIDGERFVFIPQSDFFDDLKEYKELSIGGNLVRTSDGIEIVFDERNKKLELIQKNSTDWVLLIGGDYSNWDIKFRGVFDNASAPSVDQRFNEFGLTGCLTLYKTIIDNTQLEVSDGRCEDSLNFIRVRGAGIRVLITDAFADAIDADFSELNISYLDVTNAGNDCFDVSGGVYSVTSASLKSCNDKAISIGEMSSFEGENIRINGAGIGVSSKDSSQVRIKLLDAKETSSCGEAKRKKQEFGGGVLMIKETSCSGSFSNDVYSFIITGEK